MDAEAVPEEAERLVGKKRVHEIAKAHDLSSKEVLAALKAAGVEDQAAASNGDEDAAAKAISAARATGHAGTPDSKSPAVPKPPPAVKTPPQPASAAKSRSSQSRAFDQTGASGRRPQQGGAGGAKNAAW